MIRFLPIAALLFAAALAGAQPKAASPEVRALVEKLGSEDFAEREAAGKRLDEIGAAALDALRAAIRSDNPEVSRRAKEIVRRIERRVANEKTLAPTLVELDAKDKRLDDLLDELSKAAKCDVVFGGLKLDEVANRKVTFKTNGKVPFWVAVLAICDVAEVQVASAGLYLAPDAMPYRGTSRAVSASPEHAKLGRARSPHARGPMVSIRGSTCRSRAIPENYRREHSVLLQAWPSRASSGLRQAA